MWRAGTLKAEHALQEARSSLEGIKHIMTSPAQANPLRHCSRHRYHKRRVMKCLNHAGSLKTASPNPWISLLSPETTVPMLLLWHGLTGSGVGFFIGRRDPPPCEASVKRIAKASSFAIGRVEGCESIVRGGEFRPLAAIKGLGFRV